MPVIAVINRKGGSGKSTLATHLAAWCARLGQPVMLGDIDRQHSTLTWLRLREAHDLGTAPIVSWASDARQVLRPPAGIQRVVLDTPGGLRGTDLARVVMYADAIVMPVCNSIFDRTAAAEGYAELMALPRVASGRCRLAAVGMRQDAGTPGARTLGDWAAGLGLPFLGVLREADAYVRCIEDGLTLFDLPADGVRDELAQWQPILDWVGPLLHPPVPAGPVAMAAPSPPRTPLRPVPAPTAPVRMTPAQAAAALEALITHRGQGALPAQPRRFPLLDWLAPGRRSRA